MLLCSYIIYHLKKPLSSLGIEAFYISMTKSTRFIRNNSTEKLGLKEIQVTSKDHVNSSPNRFTFVHRTQVQVNNLSKTKRASHKEIPFQSKDRSLNYLIGFIANM